MLSGKKLFFILGLILLGCNLENRFVNVAREGLPKTVKVDVLVKGIGNISGAGVLISKKGHILSAAHLFSDINISTITVYQYNNSIGYGATLLFKDRLKDLALLKIEAHTPIYAELVPYYKLRIGQEVIAIGHPLQLDFSVTHGIISQIRKNDDIYVQWTQMDAAINPGNSGGPVFNLDGDLIGISSHMYSMSIFPVNSGLNMAVSNDSIAKFLYVFEGL